MGKLQRKSIHTIEEIAGLIPDLPVDEVKTKRIMVDGDLVFVDSLRLLVFKRDNFTCMQCGLKGAFFAKEKTASLKEYYHLNLYAIDANGKEVLMTKDHHIPRSKGGENHTRNLVTMCEPCNVAKGSVMPDD